MGDWSTSGRVVVLPSGVGLSGQARPLGLKWYSTLMHVIPEHHQSIIDWAEDLPKVTAVFLLGDRAHGTAKPDSDIELGLFLGGTDSWWNLLTYLNHRRAWRLKLEKMLGLRVHLELLNHVPAAEVVRQPEAARVTLWRRG